MCVNNLSEVALDSAAAGIEHAISSRKSSARNTEPHFDSEFIFFSLEVIFVFGADVLYLCDCYGYAFSGLCKIFMI